MQREIYFKAVVARLIFRTIARVYCRGIARDSIPWIYFKNEQTKWIGSLWTVECHLS